MTELYARVNRIETCYEIHGDGYPIILIHGFGGRKEISKDKAALLYIVSWIVFITFRMLFLG